MFGWYKVCTGSSSVTRDSLLSCVSWLDLTDLSAALNSIVSPEELEKMKVLSQVIHMATERLNEKGGAAPTNFSVLDLSRSSSTVFELEFSRQLKPFGTLSDPGIFSGVDELKQFAQVRRMYRQRKDDFDGMWLKMSEKSQREVREGRKKKCSQRFFY